MPLSQTNARTLVALDLVPILVCDLEGTLVENIPYEEALERISGEIHAPLADLLRRYREEWYGLDEALAYHRSLAVTPSGKACVERIYDAFSTAKRNPTVVPGALEFLERASARGHRLICWTRGKAALQAQALAASGLERFFSDVLIVPEKNSIVAREVLLPRLGCSRFAIIGDSYEQDIVPLKGLAAIRVWVSGSKANAYIGRPAAIDDDVVEIVSVAQLLP
jgi:FMN phosphatase YigB (HAD superfamily)